MKLEDKTEKRKKGGNETAHMTKEERIADLEAMVKFWESLPRTKENEKETTRYKNNLRKVLEG